MTDLEREPTSPDNLADLRKQLTKLLTQEPALLAELIKLLPAPVAAGDRLEQHVEGAGAKAVQFHGNRNTITIP